MNNSNKNDEPVSEQAAEFGESELSPSEPAAMPAEAAAEGVPAAPAKRRRRRLRRKTDESPQEARRTEGRRLLQRRTRLVTIDVYDGYGTSEKLQVRGRLYFKRPVQDAEESDSRLRNLVNTSRRFIGNEAEKVWVQVQLREHLREVQTDHEGLFSVIFEDIGDIPYGVHTVTVTLASKNRRRMQAETGSGHFILHHLDSDRVGIISDIDDTILRTEATSKVRLLKNVFLSNYKTQSAVEGMSDIYRAIHHGPLGDGYDATHYVSSSPDNLYSRINMFLDYRKFPAGSIDLKNIGLRKGSDSLFEHEKYKLGRIQRILETYPKRRFVLFGDSGEHDPEIYRKLARQYAGQIVAVYIHNVTGADPYSSRFEGQMLFTSIDKVRRDLLKRGLVYSD
ncbi:MAG: hypothetical protein CVV27_16570 [Candidatus Melainabacteria bacterium HGW-Melainabacteria-1]|nr:MAG: hypothetical protein CVV27_16570 [Candidatus Melainabacteria bacterium HGW-Melainabacteria-1]